MTKLTPTQERILHAAASRPDGNIEPLPPNVNAGVRKRVIDGLLKRGLVEMMGTSYHISPAGFEAIDKAPPPKGYRTGTKQARMIELMRRPQGASIEEIVAETGWLPHTVRGTMTNALKKRLGLILTSEKADGEPRRYRIADGSAS